MSDLNTQPNSNTLGKASLWLGILACTFVFGVGLCAGVGHAQGWLKHVAPLLFIVGGTFAFLGLLSVLLGCFGMFARPRLIALVGLLLGVFALVLFGAILNASR